MSVPFHVNPKVEKNLTTNETIASYISVLKHARYTGATAIGRRCETVRDPRELNTLSD